MEFEMKRKSGKGEPRRGESLVDTVNVGVCACQGCRTSMEDVHRLILWSGIKKAETKHVCDHEQRSPKRQKRSIGPFCEDTTSTEDDDSSRTNGVDDKSESSSHEHNLDTKVSFFTVCDGHGGVQAADYVNAHLFNNITKHPNFEQDPYNAILEGFKTTEDAYSEFAKKEDIDGMVGTTVTAVLIIGNVLYVANLGDSEAVMCSKGEEFVLTESHVPSNPTERSRVETEGGFIVSDRKGTKRLAHPLWNPHFVNIGVTRAIGDFYFKSQEFVANKKSGLIAVPSIFQWNLTVDDEFLIIASDGFWDVVSPKEAVKLVSSQIHMDSNSICQSLMELSQSRQSRDNITVLLVKFSIPLLPLDLPTTELFCQTTEPNNNKPVL